MDGYMLYEAKLLGVSAALLICAILDAAQMKDYIQICDGLGLSALVEAHDAVEVEVALKAGARIVGVNNRNLKDFTVDAGNSRRLRALIPRDVLFVSESGVRDAGDVQAARDMGADAVLVFAVDVSSGIETDGVKDHMKMTAFVNAVRNTNQEG